MTSCTFVDRQHSILRMEPQSWTTHWERHDSRESLSQSEQALLLLADQGQEKSYAPYSKFKVGVAALLANGATIFGGNQENAAYPMCQCGEQVVLGACSAQHPGVAVLTIAITVSGPVPVPEPAAPCGSCRQIIYETELRGKRPITILLQGDAAGPVYRFDSIRDLLPFAFGPSWLSE